jgi:NAD+ diphosphatase
MWVLMAVTVAGVGRRVDGVTTETFPAPGSTPIALSAGTHDRIGERRVDDAWLAEAWADPATRVMLVAGAAVAVDQDGAAVRWQSVGDLAALPGGSPEGLRVLLGERDGVVHVALLVEAPVDEGRWATLREIVPSLGEPDAGFVVHAVALAEWHASHHFCPRCGGHLRSSHAGHVQVCEQCGRHQFPRSDPAVIMMVVDGDRALLGRQAAWPDGRYSTLAGFVDPGESLEQAVVREVAEETGVTVTDVSYFGSQPWPLPQSLMVGFFARATTRDITVDGVEIADARWLTREELRSEAEAGTLVLPGGISISRSLIEAWYGGPLPGSW